MKKKNKIIAIFMIFIILIANVSLATETNLGEIPEANVINDASNMETTDGNLEDEIMLLSGNEMSLYDGADLGLDYGDLCVMDDEVQITNQTIYGDVYVMGKDVKISSNYVDGNVFVMAQNVEITSDISGYIFVMGQNVTISGVAEGIYGLGEEINVEESANIRNDAKICCDTFNLNGVIGRNLLITSENINIIASQNSGANVYGNMTYVGNLNASEEGLISGKINKIETPEKEKEEIKKDVMSVKITDFITNAVTALVIIAIIVLLFNNKCNYETRDAISYLKDIAIGFGLLILIPVASIIIMITVIGLPIGIIGILLYVISLCIALSVASIEIANQIFKDKLDTKVKKIFAALLIYIIIKLIAFLPIIGGCIKFLCILLGLGIILKKLFAKENKNAKTDSEVIEKAE